MQESASQEWARGLPPVAVERVVRQRSSQVSGSLRSAPSALALGAAGLAPAGEAMGCAVMQLGWAGSYCGYSGMGPARVVVSSGGVGQAWRGYGLYVKALYQGYDAALSRLRAEAIGLGADGVDGVDLQVVSLDSDTREFVALGTAVRWRDGARPEASAFLTELSGQDVAKTVAAGWTPLGMAIGLSLALRHRDAAVELASRLRRLPALLAGRVPADVVETGQRMCDLLLDLLPRVAGSATLPPDQLHVVSRTATDYLPSTLRRFLALPADWATDHQDAAGNSPLDALRGQLTVLERAIGQMREGCWRPTRTGCWPTDGSSPSASTGRLWTDQAADLD